MLQEHPSSSSIIVRSSHSSITSKARKLTIGSQYSSLTHHLFDGEEVNARSPFLPFCTPPELRWLNATDEVRHVEDVEDLLDTDGDRLRCRDHSMLCMRFRLWVKIFPQSALCVVEIGTAI
jgi:hypothetical protein